MRVYLTKLFLRSLLGPDSRWSGYLQSLPKEPVGIALFWDIWVHTICNSDNAGGETLAGPPSTGREKLGEYTEFSVLQEDSEDSALARRLSVGTEIDREQRTEDGVWLLVSFRYTWFAARRPLVSVRAYKRVV